MSIAPPSIQNFAVRNRCIANKSRMEFAIEARSAVIAASMRVCHHQSVREACFESGSRPGNRSRRVLQLSRSILTNVHCSPETSCSLCKACVCSMEPGQRDCRAYSCSCAQAQRSFSGTGPNLADVKSQPTWVQQSTIVDKCKALSTARGCRGPDDSNGMMVFPLAAAFSSNFFSSVPKSIPPSSSSGSKPLSLKSDSMRPSRFSRPSIYFALPLSQHTCPPTCDGKWKFAPLGRISLLLYLRERNVADMRGVDTNDIVIAA